MKKELIKFEAEWCGQCKALVPTLERIMKEYADNVTLTTVDCAEEPTLVDNYHIRSLPTLVYLINNKEVGRLTGNVPASEIKKLLETT